MGLIYDIVLAFILVACISNYNTHFAAGIGNHSIACFAGQRKAVLEELKDIQICNHSEVCYFRYYLDDQLNRVIDAGCRSKRDCKLGECAEKFYKNQIPGNETVFRARKNLILCDECCYTGLCNKQGCGLSLNLNQMPRRCFGECTHVEDMKNCLNFTQCESENYMCVTHHLHGTSNGYTLKCERREICELLMTLSNTLDKCCDSDLCNIIPHFENIFDRNEIDDVECPKNLIPTTRASIQSQTTARNILSPTSITKTRLSTAITRTHLTTTVTSKQTHVTVGRNQSPLTITSTHLPLTITTRTMTTTATRALSASETPSKFNTTMTTLLSMSAVASKRPPVTLPPVQHTCYTCGDSTPDICEYQYEETQCNPPNNYCMNIITNSISGSRTVERKCASFDDCYNNWWQGSSNNVSCQVFRPETRLNFSFQCSFCCIQNKCNLDIKPPKATLYHDN